MNRFAPALLAAASCLYAQTLSQGERDRAMSNLHASRKMFLDSIEGLSDAQWKFKPAAGRWSIAECADHIATSEDALFEMVTGKVMKSPAAPEIKAAAAGRDDAVLTIIRDRTQKRQAPDFLQPQHRFSSREALVRHFKESRDRTIAYAERTRDDLRSHFEPHRAAGMLDAYQWLLVISGHTERHVAQINEVKADPRFPRK